MCVEEKMCAYITDNALVLSNLEIWDTKAIDRLYSDIKNILTESSSDLPMINLNKNRGKSFWSKELTVLCKKEKNCLERVGTGW